MVRTSARCALMGSLTTSISGSRAATATELVFGSGLALAWYRLRLPMGSGFTAINPEEGAVAGEMTSEEEEDVVVA